MPGEAMIGSPLMVMPRASASSRAPVTGGPTLLAPSPETSMMRRAPSTVPSSISTVAKSSARADRGAAAAPHRRDGAISSAIAAAASGLSMMRQGIERAVLRLARPFEVGDRDPAERAGGHRPDQVGVAQRRRVAVALHRELAACPSSARRRPRARSRRRPRPRGRTAPGRRRARDAQDQGDGKSAGHGCSFGLLVSPQR